jgi:Arc/MetJ-type ribon-helix-helix transcriptional regulator
MRDREELTIAISTELAETIRDAVRSGEYESPSVLIRGQPKSGT